jgi:hypothetical protein
MYPVNEKLIIADVIENLSRGTCPWQSKSQFSVLLCDNYITSGSAVRGLAP